MKRAIQAGLVGLFLLISTQARAAFHLMSITEVFPGSTSAPNAQFVELRMYAAGQNLVNGHAIQVFNAAGTLISQFTFLANVANGANQAHILIATSEASTLFGITSNLTMLPVLPLNGGKVCFDTIDCVSWGNYSGSTSDTGTPFSAAVGLTPGKSIHRRLDIAGGATTLESADDTNNSANDFVLGVPTPINNAGVIGSVPPSTCGNAVPEGLESCDDGNLVDTDGCRNSCTSPTCGDGVVSSGEACDDANLIELDGCGNSCVLTAALAPLPGSSTFMLGGLLLSLGGLFAARQVSARRRAA